MSAAATTGSGRGRELAAYLAGIAFRFAPPQRAGERFRQLVEILRRGNLHLDFLNTRLPEPDHRTRRILARLRWTPRMSTLAIAAAIHHAVRSMPADQAYVNVGVWNGFSLLAGMMGNPGSVCIGVDDFSEFHGPRAAFRARFERWRGARHRFHELDYREYFARVHRGPIGVYFYDGEHSYASQQQALAAAEPFLARGAIVLVDDTNDPEPRRATLDFMASRPGRYELLFECMTAFNGHPTFWNGLMVLEKQE